MDFILFEVDGEADRISASPPQGETRIPEVLLQEPFIPPPHEFRGSPERMLMNSIGCNPAEMKLDIFCNTNETVIPEDLYATTPLVVVRPTYTQPNEEELHTSFEEAISDRVLAVNRQLRRLSNPLTDCLVVQSPTYTPVKMQSLLACLKRPGYASRQALLYAAIALMLVMVGFDLMGLLVLQTR